MAGTPAQRKSTKDTRPEATTGDGRGATAGVQAAEARHLAATAWRLVGVLLAILLTGWIVTMTMADGGVSRLGFAYMAGRWSNPLWQAWDLLIVWLGTVHGARVAFAMVDDRARDAGRRVWWKFAVATVAIGAFALGTVAVLTFDPNLV